MRNDKLSVQSMDFAVSIINLVKHLKESKEHIISNQIGRSLLEKAEQWAIQEKAAGIRIISGATRSEAHEFYRKCGYSGDKLQINLRKIF